MWLIDKKGNGVTFQTSFCLSGVRSKGLKQDLIYVRITIRDKIITKVIDIGGKIILFKFSFSRSGLPNVRFCQYRKVHQTEIFRKLTDFTVRSSDSPSRHLLVQSQQWKHQSNVWSLFNFNNKDTRTTSMTYLINFEQISHIVLVFPFFPLIKLCWLGQAKFAQVIKPPDWIWWRRIELVILVLLCWRFSGFNFEVYSST